MTIPELVQRVKTLPAATSADQIEKFVTELLKSSKHSNLYMVRLFRRNVSDELKRRRD